MHKELHTWDRRRGVKDKIGDVSLAKFEETGLVSKPSQQPQRTETTMATISSEPPSAKWLIVHGVDTDIFTKFVNNDAHYTPQAIFQVNKEADLFPQVIFRVSSTDFIGRPELRHEVHDDGRKYVILIYDHVRALTKSTILEKLLDLTTEHLEALVNGDRLVLPPLLQSVFWPPPPIIVLSTAVILFQGYLAIHAADYIDGNASHNDVAKALSRMEWTALVENGDIDDCVSAWLLKTDKKNDARRNKLLAEIHLTTGTYWKPLKNLPKEKAPEGLVAKCKEEWRSLQSDDLPDDFRNIMRAIEQGQRLDDPTEVASAYLNLANVLDQ
jgi:hypothetical protein